MSKTATYAIIGAGPSGLSAAKALQDAGLAWQGFELGQDVGGLWNMHNPRSTVYASAHLISSKSQTEFKDFPMSPTAADYPRQDELLAYFQAYAREFDLYKHFRFGAEVECLEAVEAGGWNLYLKGETQAQYFAGVILANGTLSEPNIPQFKGEFTGEFMHSAAYKTAEVFEGKRVLVIGAGNSGCDIAVDAVHRAKKIDMSVRRGYYFVPKYVFGKPSDTVGGKIKLPRPLKQWVDTKLLSWFTGDPVRFGFPKPDYKIYESHPIVNTLILHHLGQGDLKVKADIERFEGKTVHFKDGSQEDYDLILLATGYKLHYPFIEQKYLNWQGDCPQLYLNIFHPQRDDLFVAGLVEATGIGWEGRAEQSKLIAAYLKGLRDKTPAALAFQQEKQGPNPDMSGGYKYLTLARMSYYVHKDTYRRLLQERLRRLGS